jgi:hypothetical protein
VSILEFKNPGLIDPVAMLTFGVSAKADDTAIGMFGTGLKYAIAVLLRNGFGVTILSGESSYVFSTQTQVVRGKSFDLVTMNGVSVNFTTDLGKFWEPWMAVRELASNAMDENGDWGLVHKATHDDINTTIVISGPGVDQLYSECEGVFLNTSPLFSTPTASIHPGRSNWVYYRGIRAMKLDKPSTHTYNIHASLTLTEDRTIKYDWDVRNNLAYMVNSLTNRDMMARIVSASDDWYENTISYTMPPSDLLVEVVNKLMAEFKRVPKSLQNLCNSSILQTLSEKDAVQLDSVDKSRLDKAVQFSKKIGFDVDKYPIIVTAHLGDDVLGRAVEDKIYISKRTFHMGTKMLAGTIIEEYLHLAEGVDDCTRRMQNLLFDTICSLGERVTGETL